MITVRHRTARKAAALTVAFFALVAVTQAACGDSGATPEDGASPPGGDPCSGPTPEERAQNQAVFDALAPTCAGCHSTGARGYFASIQAFESLVVYDTREVVPGKPDESELIRLLEGKGTRAFVQMPIAGPAFAELAAGGKSTMTMDAIRQWVVDLESRKRDALPSIEAPRITRLSADDVVRGLYQQLGLSDEDFFAPASNYGIDHKTAQGDDDYPITSLDAIPGPYEGLPPERFASLGGGSAMMQVKADRTVSPSFLGTLTQMSQRWCAMALDKPDNAALLPPGASVTQGSDDPEAVKKVIRHWFLHFHATDATPAEIDEMYGTVFLPLEAEKDARNGYVGLCSTFVRHPDWIFY